MKKIAAYILIFGCFYLSSVSYANELDSALSRLKTDIYRIKEEFDIPAMAIIIVEPNRVLMADISGIADRESRLYATSSTVFRIGSITKMFTSIAILMLQEDGMVTIDSKVFELFPSIPVQNKWRETHPIIVSHLLEHTAGLQDLSKDEFDIIPP
jgi:CubicO group peptidase (beta-lactamase class C family)